MKLLSALIASTFSDEKVSEEEIEKLKEKDALQGMMEELSQYLPSVKKVLIDERDQYLACKIFDAPGNKKVAVVGAGHVPGLLNWLSRLNSGSEVSDVSQIDSVPPAGRISKSLPWIIPALILIIIIFGFVFSGREAGTRMIIGWILANGTLSALGALIALAHPLVILLAFVGAPITSLNPTIGVGLFTGLLQAYIRKPRVKDFESLNSDMVNLKGWYRNRITHTLLVFFLSSLGSSIGTFVALPWIMTIFAR